MKDMEKNKLNHKDPFHLSDKEIDELMLFTGTYNKSADEQTRIYWRNAYRKVESETNAMIDKYGSVEKWYESGEGRLI
jgi:DNA repair protein RadC